MLNRQLVMFGAVGVAGFIVDAGVLGMALALGAGPWAGRLVSISLAVTVTWYCNRHLTFGDVDRQWLRQWVRFVSVNGVGALINLSVYSALIAMTDSAGVLPFLAVAAGSLAGFAWNYAGSRRLVFRPPPPAGNAGPL